MKEEITECREEMVMDLVRAEAIKAEFNAGAEEEMAAREGHVYARNADMKYPMCQEFLALN